MGVLEVMNSFYNSQCSQCRSGQGRLHTSSEESPVGPVTCGGRAPKIFDSEGSSSSLESSLESL